MTDDLKRLFSRPTTPVFPHRATVYISRQTETAIVAANYYNGQGGYPFEAEQAQLLAPPLDAACLGKNVFAALHATQVTLHRSFALHQITDSPAYKASGEPSVGVFEEIYIRIQIYGLNDLNDIYAIEGQFSKQQPLRVYSTISSAVSSIALGERLIIIFRACRDHQL